MAVLIEDDEEQLLFTTKVLQERGFAVHAYRDAESAQAIASSVERPVDLVVIDRRLPAVTGEEPQDGVGDELLTRLLDDLPDTPFVVFTGHTGIAHIQFVMKERGRLRVGREGDELDRVSHFEKEQAIEFGDYVSRIADCVGRIDDVDVIGVVGSETEARVSRRLLRRVAAHYGGATIEVRSLSGGLTDAALWSCSIRQSDGLLIARVVVKRVSKRAASNVGGLHDTLPAPNVAAYLGTVVGLCDGQQAQLMQIASGDDPVPLMSFVSSNPNLAVTQLQQLRVALDQDERAPSSSISLESLVAPLISWARLEEKLRELGLALPRPSLLVATRVGLQHGDLHPGNILVADGVPVLIDFDAETQASYLLDPVVLMWSSLFHPDSPLRGSAWPTLSQAAAPDRDDFVDGCTAPAWILACCEWIRDRRTGDREFWGLTLAYAVRQLRYPDVTGDPGLVELASVLARTAVQVLTKL